MSYDEPSFRAEQADAFSFAFAPANVSACEARNSAPSSAVCSMNLSLISTSFFRIRNPLAHPVRDRRIDLIQLSYKKVIGIFDNDQLVFAGQRGNQTFQFVYRTINIISAVYEELRLFAPHQIRKVGVVHWRSEAHQRSNSGVLASGLKSNPASETKSRNEERNVWEFRSEKIQRRANISDFALPAIVLPLAHSGAAKIETQNRKPKCIERFGGLIDYLVVHRAAEKRMRVANNCSQRWRTRAWTPQNGFQAPGGPGQKEMARFVRCAHGCRQGIASVPQPNGKTEFFSLNPEQVFTRLNLSERKCSPSWHVSKWAWLPQRVLR
jgi:hypothetical protein